MLSSYPVSVSAGSDQEEERVFGQSVSAERGICQQLEEEEVILEEDFSCSRGDASEGAATKGTKTKTHSSQVSHTHTVQERCTLPFNFNNLNNMFSLC